ncbi:hypothetical protein [Bacillus dakarensis]|uniref:hypothetical protein n=1 Tax=Robertmurraya dakarensis TaxID=1926278 RepID=UPI000981160F|nr:hypothetical protein [Bacillus dakarensis]
MHTTQHGFQQANQARQIAQQLIQQTQQGSQQYRMMLQKEQQNVQMLEQMLQRERQAVQVLEQSLHNHELAVQRCQEVVNICNQIQQGLSHSSGFGTQTAGVSQQPMFGQSHSHNTFQPTFHQ